MELAVNQLRILRPHVLIVRLIEPCTPGWMLEVTPQAARFFAPDSAVLKAAPLVDPEGFWIALASGRLPSSPEELLSLILRDERARGQAGLRLRSIDDYLESIPGGSDLQASVATELKQSQRWRKHGSGPMLVYLPTNESEPDWKERWRSEALPIHGDTEQQCVDSVESEMGGMDLPTLGRVIAAHWIPAKLRDAAVAHLKARFANHSARAEFPGIKDGALLKVAESAGREFEQFLLEAPGTSLRVRKEMLDRLRRHVPDFSDRTTVKRVEKKGSVRALAHLALLAPEVRVDVLESLFRLPPPDVDDDPESRRYLRKAVTEIAAPAVPVILEAISRVATAVNHSSLRKWIAFIAPEAIGQLDLFRVAQACGTLSRIDGAIHVPDFTALSLSTEYVATGLKRWLAAESEEQVQPDWSVDFDAPALDENWVRRIEQLSVVARDRFDRDWLSNAVARLAARALREGVAASEWQRLSTDPGNAERVLQNVMTASTQDQRMELLESARRQVEDERRALVRACAILVSETLTAIGRKREESGLASLLQVEERVREVAQGLGLQPIGQVGEVLTSVEGVHVGCDAGEKGQVRVVGIRDGDNEVLIKARLRA